MEKEVKEVFATMYQGDAYVSLPRKVTKVVFIRGEATYSFTLPEEDSLKDPQG